MKIRHHYPIYFLVAMLLAVALMAACAPAYQTGTFPPSSNAPAQAPAVAPVSVPTSAAAISAPSNSQSAPVALQLVTSATLGNLLVDGKGMTLYLFTKDTKNTSNCYDACATKWPPLISADKPNLGSGVNPDLVGMTQRKDGASQVTYNGWPLYYYQPDAQPGDIKGQGVGSVWYALNSVGEAVGTNLAPAAAANPPAAVAGAEIKVAQNASLGKFITDGKGMTLYLFTKDTKNTSSCYDACAVKWPPLLSQAKPTLGDGIKADLIGTTQRKDGSTQLTYNGWPLYYYQPDKNAGDTLGQGVGSVWYVLGPGGDPIKAANP